MISILIAEDQALVRGALAALLDFEADFEVVGQAPDGLVAVELALALKPDIALLDVEMPHRTGLEVVAVLRQRCPATRSILVTTFARPGYLQQAIRSGACGYLLKAAQVEELAAAIRHVHGGQIVIDPSLMRQAWSLENPLTEREVEVLRAAADGLSTRAIATSCHLGEGTVRNYLSQIFAKLDVRTRQEAIRAALEKGWI